MSSSPGYKKKTVEIDQRKFLVQVLTFENGNFISITEGTEKIGAMVVSIGYGPTPSTAIIIPTKSQSLFLKMISERIASVVKGICIASVNTQKDLEPNITKLLLKTIMEIVH